MATQSTTTAFAAALRNEIQQHPAVHHIFLNRCATSPLAKQDYAIMGEHHYPVVCCFANHVDRLLYRTSDQKTKTWLHKALVEPSGEDRKPLYHRFLTEASAKHQDPLKIDSEWHISAPAHRFIQAHRRLIDKEPVLVGFGALGPGHFWSIPTMFTSVIPGLRRAGFTDHAIRFFTLRADHADERTARVEEALHHLASTSEARAQIRHGVKLGLDAREQFWTGVQSAVVRYRQPRAARPDGPRPRSLPHEILLTAWDGWKPAQLLAQQVNRLREQARPTIAQLLDNTKD